MASRELDQLTIHSRFAYDRATWLATKTGMSTDEVVEEALRAYVPPTQEPPPGGLVREGKLLVFPATGNTITVEELIAEMDEARDERG